MKRAVVALAWCLTCVPFPASAQQSGRLQTAETSFDYTLGTLRESVDKLTLENKNLAANNEQLRGRLRDLGDELKSLQRDEARVLDQFEALEGRYQNKMQDSRSSGTQLARLRQESASIDEEFGKLSATVSEKDKADQALGQAIEALGQDIRSLKAGVHPALSGEGALLAEQRDRLRKQSSAALVSLQAARQQWLDIQGVNDLGPERVEALRKGRDELEALIQAKELSKANLLKQAAEDENTLAELTSPTKANGSGIAQLEQELRSLNSHSQGLGSELQKLQQSDMDRTRKINESVEQEKQQWEAKLAEGVGQNKALRLELDKLRKEMIDLDKKKAAMEKALYGQ